jgi:hypothetical protein
MQIRVLEQNFVLSYLQIRLDYECDRTVVRALYIFVDDHILDAGHEWL